MTGRMLLCLFGILISARITLQAASPASTFYVGAAVEYHPITKGDNGTVIADMNAENYLKFLQKADAHDVDIVVFPEGSLTAGRSFPAEQRTRYLPHSSYVPDPKDLEIPCKNDSSSVMQALKAMSCAAKQYATYIVVNVREKSKCINDDTASTTPCSPDGWNLYNTNVVFDRKGTLIARYRKFNLFGEPGFNRTTKPELSTFKTDFNVTFGQFICFDILFDKPALRLIRDEKITDIVFPTMWHSELPFLTAPQIQSAWSYANNVNMIGSGYNDPSLGSGGSGIYAGNEGTLNSYWSEKRSNAILISEISKVTDSRRIRKRADGKSMTYVFTAMEMPTIEGAEPVSQLKIANDDVETWTTHVFSPTNGSYDVSICDRGLCCEFSTDTTHIETGNPDDAKFYRYRFAVFNGVRTFADRGTGGIELCGIITCTNDTESSCGRRFDTNDIIVHPTTFNSIVVSGNFTAGPNVFHMPMSVNTDIQPLNATDFTFATKNFNDTHTNVKYTLKHSRKGLMTFAIWGRNFTTDGTTKTTRSSSSQSHPFGLMMTLAIVVTAIVGNRAIANFA